LILEIIVIITQIESMYFLFVKNGKLKIDEILFFVFEILIVINSIYNFNLKKY